MGRGPGTLTGNHDRPARRAFWLVERWAERWDDAEVDALLAANNREAPVVVRPWGITSDELAAELTESGVRLAEPSADAVWATGSLQLAPGAALTELGAYRQGRFFVQDPASTLVTQYAAVPEGATVSPKFSAYVPPGYK